MLFSVEGVIRWFFVFVNFIVLASGIGLIVLATVTLTSSWSFLHLLQDADTGDEPNTGIKSNRYYKTDGYVREKYNRSTTFMHIGCYMLIISGVLLVILAGMACLGALLPKRSLLAWYSTFILLVLILELSASLYTAFHTPSRSAFYILDRSLTLTLQRAYVGDERVQGRDRLGELNTATLAWNSLMQQLHCCGVNGSDDFVTSGIITNRKYRVDGAVPKACCKTVVLTSLNAALSGGDDAGTCPARPTEQNSYMHIGCYRAFREYLITTSSRMLAMTFAVGALLLVAMLLACAVFYFDKSRLRRITTSTDDEMTMSRMSNLQRNGAAEMLPYDAYE